MPKENALVWWHDLAATGRQVFLFDRDPVALELARQNIDRFNWHASYWVDDNFGGIVRHGTSMVWVGIPRIRFFSRTAMPADHIEVLYCLLPNYKWFRSLADFRLRSEVYRSLRQQGLKRVGRPLTSPAGRELD
jgi:hypothetical protein